MRDFDELFDRIANAIGRIPGGMGDLTVYDVAVRIGASLTCCRIASTLQAGAREGARALGLDVSQRSRP